MTTSAQGEGLRILNVEPRGYSEGARQKLLALGTLVEKTMTQAQLHAALPGFGVLIVRLDHQIDRQTIRAGKRLKAIVSATTGLDHLAVNLVIQAHDQHVEIGQHLT